MGGRPCHTPSLQSHEQRKIFRSSCNIREVGATLAGLDADETKMRQVRRWVDTEDEEAGINRQTASLAAMAVLLLLVVVSFALFQELRYKATVEDCLMSGRTNCGVAIPLEP